jgi:hypothetical protein
VQGDLVKDDLRIVRGARRGPGHIPQRPLKALLRAGGGKVGVSRHVPDQFLVRAAYRRDRHRRVDEPPVCTSDGELEIAALLGRGAHVVLSAVAVELGPKRVRGTPTNQLRGVKPGQSDEIRLARMMRRVGSVTRMAGTPQRSTVNASAHPRASVTIGGAATIEGG